MDCSAAGEENGCRVGRDGGRGWAAVAAVPDPLHFAGDWSSSLAGTGDVEICCYIWWKECAHLSLLRLVSGFRSVRWDEAPSHCVGRFGT